MNHQYIALFFFFCFAAPLAGCSGDVDVTPEPEITDHVDMPLSVRGLTSARVSHHPGLTAVDGTDSCARGEGNVEVDLLGKKLTASLCATLPGAPGARMSPFTRALSDGEAASITATIGGVRRAARPSACSTDGPSGTLNLVRGGRASAFIDAPNSCFVPAVPVDGAHVKSLFDELAVLAVSTGDAVVTPASTAVRITYHPGFVAVPPGDACARGQGDLRLDLASGRLEGTLCFAAAGSATATLEPLAQTLSGQQLGGARARLAIDLREVPVPSACPSDADGGSVDVSGTAGVVGYVNAYNSCFQTARKAIDDRGHRAAFGFLAELLRR